ncbi:MAG: hypothetical protein DI563_05260 [Variovorax paradoxus]|uniref:DUF4148 domain-containing protein n=1 Tax=Variovorax paradoxus TaxID=34073 RepID=A0A2W5QIF6_VARPD|nr:MAG: hypothetical protein DI563_05260 [Variovorax paradoxus]
MKKLIAVAACVLTALSAAPALAGNYQEGDPRPVARSSTISSSEVASQTSAWLATAPTVGYPEGNPRSAPNAGQKTRAMVQADTMNWIRSGLAAYSYGDSSIAATHPHYIAAQRSYAQLSANPTVTQADTPHATGAQ